MYVDTHLHLHEPWLDDSEGMTEAQRAEAVADITQHKIVTWAQSCDVASYERTLHSSARSEYILPSFGILPWYAHQYADRLDYVAELCEAALMLGEIGLDEKYAPNRASIPHQRPLFEAFLEASEKHNLIMNLHFRGGLEREGFEYLKSYDVKRAIFHSYSGPPSMIQEINDQGYYCSYGAANFEGRGNPRGEAFTRKLQLIPDDRLVLEIDVLSIPSFQVPSIVFSRMLKVAAELKNTTAEELEAINCRNVRRLVGDDPKLSQMTRMLKT
jgi:TatD DNase family protein